MASNAMIGLGAIYEIEDSPAGTGTFTAVAEVITLTFPNSTTDEVEVTHYGSDGREFIGGLTDYGTAEFGINWIAGDSTSTLIMGLRDSKEILKHRVTLNSKTYTFDGWVNSFSPETPIDDRITATVGVRVSGAISEADAA